MKFKSHLVPGAAAVLAGVGAVPADLRDHLQLLLSPHIRRPGGQGAGLPLRRRGRPPRPKHRHAGAHPEEVNHTHQQLKTPDDIIMIMMMIEVKTEFKERAKRSQMNCLVKVENRVSTSGGVFRVLRRLTPTESFDGRIQFSSETRSPVNTATPPPDCDNFFQS